MNAELLKDDIRRAQTLDSVARIEALRMSPHELSQMKILLCRLVPMPVVHPTLASDLIQLEQQFVHGYEEGVRVFYVYVADELNQTSSFSLAEKDEWGEIWNSINDKFNRFLESHGALKQMVDCKFFVYDGNHRRIAWMNHILCLHSREIKWHISVDSIVLDTRNRIGLTMQVMHDVNKYVFLDFALAFASLD